MTIFADGIHRIFSSDLISSSNALCFIFIFDLTMTTQLCGIIVARVGRFELSGRFTIYYLLPYHVKCVVQGVLKISIRWRLNTKICAVFMITSLSYMRSRTFFKSHQNTNHITQLVSRQTLLLSNLIIYFQWPIWNTFPSQTEFKNKFKD